MSNTNGNGRKDVTIQVPTARLNAGALAPAPSLDSPPSAEELCQIYYQAIRTLKVEKSELVDFARGVSSICLALTKMMIDQGAASDTGEVTVPKWLHQQMLGASITTRVAKNGDIVITLRESGPERIVPGF